MRGRIAELDPEQVRQAIAVSAFGGFLVVQQAARRMAPHGHGAILLTGATASVKGFPLSSAFAMGKFALRGLAQSAARELSPPGDPCCAFRDRRRGEERRPSRSPRSSRQHSGPRRCRPSLPRRPAPATQRLELGDRAAPLGRDILSGARMAARR
ncbi:MAG: SDR family NAD(P)-dependent oxidoreductase [Caulobacteraceae bacterium]